jgi:hypothetical protein
VRSSGVEEDVYNAEAFRDGETHVESFHHGNLEVEVIGEGELGDL